MCPHGSSQGVGECSPQGGHLKFPCTRGFTGPWGHNHPVWRCSPKLSGHSAQEPPRPPPPGADEGDVPKELSKYSALLSSLGSTGCHGAPRSQRPSKGVITSAACMFGENRGNPQANSWLRKATGLREWSQSWDSELSGFQILYI